MEDKNIHTKKDLNEILDKLLKLQESQKKPSFLRKTVYVSSSICVIVFVILICACIYKNSFTIESIFATLLAFFSIFISIFFYFKADETSNRFYDSSYKFMKDISVTLGKIEERFGEKLNSLNEKISHLDKISFDTTEEIKDKTDDKDNLINDLLDKANLNEEEKKRYREELAEKDAEIEILKNHKYQAEREASRLRRRLSEFNITSEERIPLPSKAFLKELLRTHDTTDIPFRGIRNLQKLGIIDQDGEIDDQEILNMLDRNLL